jgi:murein DD-endopeptidase MepM/ murein hydrolase activator NlpD
MPVAPVVAPVVVTIAALLAAGTFAVVASPAAPTTARRPPAGAPDRAAPQRLAPRAAIEPSIFAGRVTARRFRWPLTPVPRVLRGFVVGPYPWSPGHRGVDLGAAAGEQVLAAGPGVVIFARPVAGRGVVVVGHAGGLRTTYEPVIPGVRVGQAVEAGTPTGTLEAVHGHCAGPCLHWGAVRGGVYVDPLSLLDRARLPVLLPDDGPG